MTRLLGPAQVTVPVLLAASATSLALALQVDDGMLEVAAILFLTAALWSAFRAILGAPLPWLERRGPAAIDAALGLGIAAEIAAHLLRFPSIYFKPSGFVGRLPFYAAMVVLAAVVGLAFRRPERWVALRLPVLLAVYLALGIWIIPNVPNPPMDVLVFQREGVAALLAGQNPYTITFPDLYHGTSVLYGPGMSVGGRLQFGFVYPPLSLLLAIPGYLVGDVRYAHLAAMTGAAALMAGARPGRTGFLAAVLFLFSPRTYLVVERAWTEPFVVLLLALLVFCACRRRGALPIAIGLFFASKQYLVLAIPALSLLFPRPVDERAVRGTLLKAVVVGAVVTLPLALWDIRAFVYSVASLQFHQPFRVDALSYLAAVAWLTGWQLPSALAFVAAIVAMVLALWRCPRTPAGFCAGLALTYFAFFAFNKQAFCNYYYFVLGALSLAVATWREEESATAAEATPHSRSLAGSTAAS